jgi:hypothetical protein
VKKVRYVTGAIGAVPAVGMLMVGAAPHVPKSAAKTVNLGHRAAARHASGAAGPAISSCQGTTEVHETTQGIGPHKPSMSTKFWYKKAAGGSGYCIGTVEAHWNDTSEGLGVSSLLRIRVYSGQGLTHRAYQMYANPSRVNGHTYYAASTVRRWFGLQNGLPVEICTAWTSAGTGNIEVAVGPECKTFG